MWSDSIRFILPASGFQQHPPHRPCSLGENCGLGIDTNPCLSPDSISTYTPQHVAPGGGIQPKHQPRAYDMGLLGTVMISVKRKHGQAQHHGQQNGWDRETHSQFWSCLLGVPSRKLRPKWHLATLNRWTLLEWAEKWKELTPWLAATHKTESPLLWAAQQS